MNNSMRVGVALLFAGFTAVSGSVGAFHGQTVPTSKYAIIHESAVLGKNLHRTVQNSVKNLTVYFRGKKLTTIHMHLVRGVYYFPVLNVLPVFRALGGHAVLTVTRQELSLGLPEQKIKITLKGTGNFRVILDGHLLMRMENTKYGVSLLQWMKLLNALGMKNDWNPIVSSWQIEQPTKGLPTSIPPTSGSSGLQGQPPVQVVSSVKLSSPSSMIAASGQTETITATVLDAKGHPISGVTVNFVSSAMSVEEITTSAVTNSQGIAQATITSGTQTGSSTITAVANGVSSSPVTVQLLSANSPLSYINSYNSNQHTSDQKDWQQAGNNLYISAQTDNPNSQSGKGTSLLNTVPNQPLYLFAYSSTMNVLGANVTWSVNSLDATVSSSSSDWTMGNYQIAGAVFTATKPGIYTVQAKFNGKYSVPLVLTVGMNQLQSTPFATAPSQTGILPLPANLTAISAVTESGVTYKPYPANQNWIPIAGSTTASVSAMNVILDGPSGQEWSYRMSVINGQFSGEVLSPFTGQVQVTIFPKFFQALTKSVQTGQSYVYPNSSYSVQVTGSALSAQNQALLASAQRDYNMSPSFAKTADILLENSPSMETAIAAISNYASESIIYNQKELQNKYYLWQDALTAWQTGSGVCEDYASLAASLLDSVDIPTQTVGGWANQNWTTPPLKDTNSADAHEWDQAWNGSNWVVFDPTWNTDDTTNVAHYITSEFFTNTADLASSHLADPNQTGLDN